MKTTRIIRIVACVVVLAYAASNVRADFTFGAPVTVGAGLGSSDSIDCFSYDGLEMYIDSIRPGGQGDWDFWVLKRASTNEDWGPPENLGPGVNSPMEDSFSSISADGLTLYFSSNRPGGVGDYDIYVTTRAGRNDAWGQAVNLGPTINSSSVDGEPWISPDDLELYFESYRSGGYGFADIYVARRLTASDPWSAPVNLGPVVNSAYREQYLSLSVDGLLLLFCEHPSWGTPRPGGYGGADMWMARRATLSDPWQAPVNLGPMVNGPAHDCEPRISPDGRTLYFWSNRTNGYDVWQAPIIPNCDFNADGTVGEQDILVMRLYWGQNYPPCDIGPFPWGDGIVDGEDLRVLLEYTAGTDADWTEPAINPPLNALDVPRDAILSWTPAGLGETCDVYFGVSLDDITGADRDNPLGVLVSRGQMETTYDPPGLLAFGTTYYWRIDEVGPAPDYTVYKWPVLDFTTELLAYPIEGVIATSNAVSQAGTQPQNTVNGSGLNGADEHSISAGDMWLVARSEGEPTWIQYEFDNVYRLHEMWVWNYNSQFEMVLGIGLKDVTVEYSQNGTDWTALGDVQLAQATAKATYAHNTTVDFAGVAARYVRIVVHSGWGTLSSLYGLSEVRFLYVPTRSWKPQPADGATGVTLDATLRWHAGREAVLHEVYLSTNRQAVADGTALVDTVPESSYRPDWLDPGQTYYWRINEINEAEDFSIWEGDVWEFRTIE